MPERLFIEAFEGDKGRAEVYEIVGKDSRGIEKVVYEVLFKEQRQEVLSMGEASVLASQLAGDARFSGAR